MNWFHKTDKTTPIITSHEHILSSHGNSSIQNLPKTCCFFQFSSAIEYIEKTYSTSTVLERTPNFLENRKVVSINSIDDVAFLKGGYGAPAAVDLLETVLALGVKKVIIIGLCGGFTSDLSLGDCIIPNKIYSEEGTSHHYYENPKWIHSNNEMRKLACGFFSKKHKVRNKNIVTTDAIYRQTYFKERIWRKYGCVGVDMEASALTAVCNYYNIPSVSIFLVSDIHPIEDNDKKWSWDKETVLNTKKAIVSSSIEYCKVISMLPITFS